MSQVQVSNVPTSASPEELRQLFAQLGPVKSLLTSFEATKPEGTALVVYADAAAAQAAVELLDGYPLGTSLLEVQTTNRDNFVGRLVSSLLALQMDGGSSGGSGGGSRSGGAAPTTAPASSSSGVAALEEEMRQLQLQLQQQADSIQAWAWQGEESPPRQQAAPAAREEDEWQEAARPQRRGAGGRGAGRTGPMPAAGRGYGATPVTNPGLWLGWIDMAVEKPQLAQALSQWGRVYVESLVSANELASNGKRYKWAIVFFERVEDAQAAKRDLDRQPLPGISHGLKIMPYEPGRHGGRK
ncbi:hypothetical protein COHA_001630 [Chlorella ohadii]|uniref:RRM domain-containing protein n=1 Tax=Chlorella ohadii TaxID=2649997 RepID=A0AAD5H992_9CHLO|nr:hypothetical protein COHA_001630 [Chlorella ohadii]